MEGLQSHAKLIQFSFNEIYQRSHRYKIFSVVILIVTVMVGVSIVNVRLESRVGQALDRVSNHYLIAYGSLARANLRSVEQALNIRRLMLATYVFNSENARKNAEEQILAKGKQFWEEVTLFHKMIELELKEKNSLVGNIGSDKTKNFTVIGDTVNLVSRLESSNKIYGTETLITEETALLLNSTIVTREIDTIVVPGKNEAKKVFEIMGLQGGLSTSLVD